MHLAVEGQEVVFAQAVELDVLDEDHLGAVFVENAVADDLIDVLLHALRELEPRSFDSLGRPQQPSARRIFTDLRQQIADERSYRAGVGPRKST
jgi:hypothetical protein